MTTYTSLKSVKNLNDAKALSFKAKAIALSALTILILIFSTLFSGGYDFEGDYVLDLSKYSEKEARLLSKLPEDRNVFSIHGNEMVLAGEKTTIDVLSHDKNVYQISVSLGEKTTSASITLLENGSIQISGSGFGRKGSGWYLNPKH
ncbi:hypothetical protein F3S07_22325 [Vibrio alginolyticus]|uniref:hypothetical protein n=1 Tax=Vibrio harveyi group TaxID=717610 RepID=UPI0011229962|nr:hypothetical protein [Vibrio parahaemolyticus]EGQ9575892.1 hypothetical protein [Vibrio alginolyticus]EHH1191601.1 hypothetical protein [Vibrio vulnificus]EGQ8551516.1 hypothetical protein [Vibrio parahaemolyticus]EJC6996420.1 hypothetical protein [Vibrio parahaemolyticus]EJG0708256.1 hypothetical protein [Vibrio parahaemolyticus]